MSHRIVSLPRIAGLTLGLLLLLFVVATASILIGPAEITVRQVLKDLFTGWQNGWPGLSEKEKTILFSIRLPRILFSGIVGAALASAGVVFQALLRNPLADPYILGVSGGAAVGAMIGIIGAGFMPLSATGLAFLGAIVTVILVFGIARSGRELKSSTLLLAGVIVNAFFSAIIMFLISTSKNADIHSIMFWLMGDLSMADSREILFAGLFVLFGFFILYSFARSMNLLAVSEETALQLGIDVEKTKILLFLVASLMTATAVSVSGIIGFVGLIIPHIMRMLIGSDHRVLLPATFLFGASFLILADTAARTVISPAELPVGAITALFGAPYFIYLLKRRRSV